MLGLKLCSLHYDSLDHVGQGYFASPCHTRIWKKILFCQHSKR
jgi:hypothetical protein